MEKDWFKKRIQKAVEFSFQYLDEPPIVRRETIKDEQDAGYMWLMSQKGYKFKDVEHG